MTDTTKPLPDADYLRDCSRLAHKASIAPEMTAHADRLDAIADAIGRESERNTARNAELMALLVTALDYVAAEVERLAAAYGHQLQHKQQPGRDDLAAIDAAIAGERDE